MTRSKGKVSFIDRSRVRALNASVSCESIDVPKEGAKVDLLLPADLNKNLDDKGKK